ncbi:NAD-dependent dehydratase [Arthrobacter sp. MYb227]|uniref:SDR family oxidoreductase n=1 Tax=Arthrobacter sp. MYb227 TaxID=1848601 RepID=UPI000CFBA411|nr:SDR family oxidoreductase [Arthrobacter sp. MYb227]PQZ95000.1 NAD-dependent dehydratase [Arthrobacter sp. MYb227]
MKVTIIGGHGKVAILTAELLAQRGDSVTSIIRNPAQVAAVESTGASALVLSVESASTEDMAAAFAGSDAIVWSAGAGGGIPERTYAVDRDAAIRSMDAAEKAGVKRYVMVSFATASPQFLVPEDDSFFPYMDAKIAADQYLRASALDFTILGPGLLTLDAPTGLLNPSSDPAAGPEASKTSRGNVALSIIATLDQPATIGKTINYSDGQLPVAEAILTDGDK